jgi:hypothetical protein
LFALVLIPSSSSNCHIPSRVKILAVWIPTRVHVHVIYSHTCTCPSNLIFTNVPKSDQ